MNPFLIFLLLVSFITLPSAPAETPILRLGERLNGSTTVSAFADAMEASMRSTIRILEGNEVKLLGTIVSPDGLVVTKASNYKTLKNPVVEEVNSEVHYQPTLLGVDGANDLALLRIPGNHFLPIDWMNTDTIAEGIWVASPDQHAKSVNIGIIAAASRTIPRLGGVMGVRLENTDRGVSIAEVFEKSAAKASGLKVNDLIVSINKQIAYSRDATLKNLDAFNPGDTIHLHIRRNENEKEILLTLGHHSVVFDVFNRNQMLSGVTSKKRTGFEQVIHHDTPLHPDGMGSPLLSVDGLALGINIARVDRVTTFALPKKVVSDSVRKILRAHPPQNAGGE